MPRPSAYELLHGVDAPPPSLLVVRAGQLTAVLDGIDLRRVQFGNIEIVRRLTVAIRDVNWNTLPNLVTHLELQQGEGEFRVEFDASNRSDAIDFCWHGAIVGDVRGAISYFFDGSARKECEYARIGLCVLHPVNEHRGCRFCAAGEGCVSSGVMPDLIASQRIVSGIPLALFSPYSELAMRLAPGGEVHFTFDGDLFEMEDQRNWSDASFKSYSTPVALGRSREARTGERISQSVTVAIEGVPEAPDVEAQLELKVGSVTGGTLPSIGLGAALDGQPLSPRDAELLRAVAPDHLRADIDLREAEWETALRAALAACRQLGCALELALFVNPAAADYLDDVGALLATEPIARVLVFASGALSESPTETTPPELMTLARERLGPRLPGVPLGGGTDMYFAELNRTPPEPGLMDIVAYAVVPQVHATDDLSLFETLEAQADTVRSGLLLADGRPLAVGPITLHHRRPFYGKGIDDLRGLPERVDSRQMSRLLAPWTVGSIKSCAEAGASTLTYFETTGPCGLLEREDAALLPGFPSAPGMVFPVHAVFQELARHKGSALVTCASTKPLEACGLALRRSGVTTVITANLTDQPRAIRIPRIRGLARLGQTVGHASIVSTLRGLEIYLEPYGVSTLSASLEAEG